MMASTIVVLALIYVLVRLVYTMTKDRSRVDVMEHTVLQSGGEPLGILIEYANTARATYRVVAVTHDIETHELILLLDADGPGIRIPTANVHAYSIGALHRISRALDSNIGPTPEDET
jgi:hypothetical protein